MNNNLLEEEAKPSHTKIIQEMQPTQWCRKSKKLTRSTRFEEEKLGRYAKAQSKRFFFFF
jgi:hypothetical protein